GADDWGTLRLDWRPFYQDKPTVRARVVAPDGQIVELDQSLLTDTPAVSESPTIFSDRRKLAAPLPRLVIGAVVEEEWVKKDREPLLKAGVRVGASVGRSVPVRSTIVTISAPAARSVRVLPRGFTKSPVPRRATRDGRSTWRFELGPM